MLAAVRRADVLWLLDPIEPTVGAWVEVGIALERGIAIIASGAGCRDRLVSPPALRRDA